MPMATDNVKIVTRPYAERARQALVDSGVHPVLARVYAAREVRAAADLDNAPTRLLAPARLGQAEAAGALLADALAKGRRILIISDYDADGATACAVGVRGLRALARACGQTPQVDYLVPNRFELGYGLSPELVDLAAARKPDLLVTVDNGIASVEGVARARALGVEVLITDHHLPGPELPAARCIVNPNQPGCGFPSKALAGVGVMFYVLLALRAVLRARGAFGTRPEPNLGTLTDLVALGTIADVVPLDVNNRILVSQGLKRVRAGLSTPGIAALLHAAGRHHAEVGALDLGFLIGPRLNAAGRLADMGLGIECLITDDGGRAANIAQELDQLNRERRRIETGMLEEALDTLIMAARECGAAFYRPGWHQGVIGILAARLRERLHRPVVCFANAGEGANAGLLRGSGRSIPGFHLRDCLDLMTKRAPGLILRFGGHAQAAGLTLRTEDYPRFEALFSEIAGETMPPGVLSPVVETDGSLEPQHMSLAVAQMLASQIWGQGFPQPLFCDTFLTESQRVVGEKHLKLRLSRAGQRFEAIRFGSLDPFPRRVEAAYRLAINEYNGLRSVQLIVEHIQPASRD